RFNPFTLVLEARAFSMPDADGAELLAFERLMVNLELSSLWKRGASFADIELDRPQVRVLLRADGTVNLADLAPKSAEPQPPEDDAPARLFIDRLSVREGRIGFEDLTGGAPFATELR